MRGGASDYHRSRPRQRHPDLRHAIRARASCWDRCSPTTPKAGVEPQRAWPRIGQSLTSAPDNTGLLAAITANGRKVPPIPGVALLADTRSATEPRGARIRQADFAARGARFGFSTRADAAAALACRPFDPRPILCAISRRAAE